MYATFLERMGEVYDPAKIKGEFPQDILIKATHTFDLDGKFGAMMSVALTNEGPVTFILDSQSEAPDTGGSSGSLKPGSGNVTPRGSPAVDAQSSAAAAQRVADKALRKAAWEAAKKQAKQDKEDAPVSAESQKDANTAS